jgi:acrylyl-CoA reductase (NADPH)
MAETFPAIVIDKQATGQRVDFRQLTDADLMPGSVTVAVEHSTVNFKDGLALTGKAPIVRQYPMVPGVDFAGTVIASSDTDFRPGDKVVMNGQGAGESHFGGFAGRARVPGEWLVKVPDVFSTADAMSIGTAGFTAMLCVLALEDQGVRPDEGDIVVTGAAGGVGSVAIAVLARLGYRVVASTGRPAEAAYLTSLGASSVIDRHEFDTPAKALGKMRWAGAVDSVGSVTLANIVSQTVYGGTVTACGLAQGADLPTTVHPFILRGVKLIGIDSVHCPLGERRRAWTRLAKDLDRSSLAAMTSRVKLADVPKVAADIVEGKVRGRIVVDVA